MLDHRVLGHRVQGHRVLDYLFLDQLVGAQLLVFFVARRLAAQLPVSQAWLAEAAVPQAARATRPRNREVVQRRLSQSDRRHRP